MRLKVSADKLELRQSYLPSLFPYVVKPLMDHGTVRRGMSSLCYLSGLNFTLQGAVDEVIERMDEYFLSREDWDTVVELGVDDHRDDHILKKIPTATKTAFTRK